MHLKRLFLLLTILSIFSTGCRRRMTVAPVEELAFRASSGLSQYEEEAYSQLMAVDGPLELYHMLVTNYVTTDQKLAAECSDIGAVNVKGTSWISESIIRRSSVFHDDVRIYCSRTCGNLTICGELYAFQTHFEGDVHVDDSVTADCSCFHGCLTAKAEIIDLQSSCARTIVVEPTGPYYDPQVVRLANGSVVSGDIHFKSGRGKVCIDQTSSLEGQIFGGHIVPPHYWQTH
ncbi:MAG: hypothetical protein LLG04_15175 [Parachlamydia sp.]|nr:hypothetical protein [Parachlamydia sp.]